MTSHINEILAVAREAALKAGSLIVDYREKGLVSTGYKDTNDLVTSADIAAEKLIIEIIQRNFPDHGILCEESNPHLQRKEDYLGPLWIVDPIDGTTNYAYNQLQVAVSIAWSENGVTEAAVVHAPFQHETFSAMRSGGAFLNGQPVKTRPESSLASALIATGFRRRTAFDPEMLQLRAVLSHCRDIRRLGSAALDICWVACGRLDGFYETIKTWDFAAANLIAREAGAITGHIYDLPADLEMPEEFYGYEILVATPAIYQQLREVLRIS